MSVSTYAHNLRVGNESGTFKGMCESFRWLVYQQFKPFLVQLTWLLRFLDCMAWGPTVLLTALTCLHQGPKTGRFSRALGVVGLILIFMY